MKKMILTGLAMAGYLVAVFAAPAYRFDFADAGRADNAMLQGFQKKAMKLYSFVPEAGKPQPEISVAGAAIPAGWCGSYRTGDRRLFAGDRLELCIKGVPEPNSFQLELSTGQPLRWGKSELLSPNWKSDGGSGGETILLFTVPQTRDRCYLRKLLISTDVPLTMKSFEIDRHAVSNRIDADRILAFPPEHDVKVTRLNGVPQITIDGNPFCGLGFGSFIHQQYGNYPDMLGKTGYRLAFFVVNLGEDILTKWNTPSWLGKDHFDFSAIDAMARRLRKISPDVRIILQVQLDGAEWWTLAHPQSGGIHAREGVPGYLSPEWRHDCRDAVRQLVAHVQSSPYAGNVIGYELFNGVSMDCNFEVNDETPAALGRFRAMLREKYGSDAALRKAWNNASVTLETAVPETLSEYAAHAPQWKSRLLADDPARTGRWLDSKRFREIAFQKVILEFARWIKEAAHNRVLVGARTGDFMANQWNLPEGGVEENDCNPVDLLLASPDFDYFDIQPPYLGRHRLGTQGGGTPHLPVQALWARNKLIVIQDDVPHLVKPSPDRQTQLQMKRLVNTYCLFNGALPYQFQMSHYRLNSPELLDEFKRHLQIFEKASQLDRSTVAQTAVVFDLDYQRRLGLDTQMRSPSRTAALLDHLKWTWNRAGIPFDMILLQDLPKARDYRLYIFANTFDGSPEKRKIIETAVKNSGKVAVFLWADGFFDSKQRSAEAMSRLTGIRIKASDTARSWTMTPAAALDEAVSEQFPLGRLIDTEPGEPGARNWKYAPSFTVEDPSAITLATYSGSKDVAIAVKKYPNWTAIYNASVVCSPALLRYSAKQANLFSYTDAEDLFYVDSSFAAFHFMEDGERVLCFPVPTVLYEVYTQKEYPAAMKFTVPAARNQTSLFFRGTKKQWEELASSLPLVSPWHEPDPFEAGVNYFQGKDPDSGAIFRQEGDGFRFHVPWNGVPARLFVELDARPEELLTGTIQVYDRRSDGIGVSLARRNGTAVEILERISVRADGKPHRIRFPMPAMANSLLLFDSNGNTQFDTADLQGFGVSALNRTGVISETRLK